MHTRTPVQQANAGANAASSSQTLMIRMLEHGLAGNEEDQIPVVAAFDVLGQVSGPWPWRRRPYRYDHQVSVRPGIRPKITLSIPEATKWNSADAPRPGTFVWVLMFDLPERGATG